MQSSDHDQTWKSLAAESNMTPGIRSRNLRPAEKRWLTESLRQVHKAYVRHDINTARIQSHNIVSNGYRRMGNPQAWERLNRANDVMLSADPLQHMLGQLQQQMHEMQAANQAALEQAMLEQMQALYPGVSFSAYTTRPPSPPRLTRSWRRPSVRRGGCRCHPRPPGPAARVAGSSRSPASAGSHTGAPSPLGRTARTCQKWCRCHRHPGIPPTRSTTPPAWSSCLRLWETAGSMHV